MKRCLHCKKLIKKKSHYNRLKFCDRTCWIAYSKKDKAVIRCADCGKKVFLSKSTAERRAKYCNQECYRKHTEPYQKTHGFASKKNKFIRDRYTVVLNRLKKVIPDFKARDLPEDYWRALMLCELAMQILTRRNNPHLEE